MPPAIGEVIGQLKDLNKGHPKGGGKGKEGDKRKRNGVFISIAYNEFQEQQQYQNKGISEDLKKASWEQVCG